MHDLGVHGVPGVPEVADQKENHDNALEPDEWTVGRRPLSLKVIEFSIRFAAANTKNIGNKHETCHTSGSVPVINYLDSAAAASFDFWCNDARS